MMICEVVGQGLQIRIGQIAFVGSGKKPHFCQQFRQQRGRKSQFHLLQLFAEQSCAGMPAHDHFRRRVAHVFCGEGFVSCSVLQQAAAMDARFVAENRRAGHGLFQRKRTARRVRDQIAQRRKLPRIHAAIFSEREPRGHDDFVQGRVAGAFAEPVDGNTRRVCAGGKRGDGVCRRHAEIVVSVKFEAQVRRGRTQLGK